jgi:tripartite-type tricarboxylate transporter receptor subunit TctC
MQLLRSASVPNRPLPHALVIAIGMMFVATFDSAIGQHYPSRPITAIVPHATAGATDITARILIEKMKEVLGQPIVVENVPMAAGTVGVGRLLKAPRDGYTIAIGDQTSFVISSMSYKMTYDVLADFEPIALLSTSPSMLVARRTLPPANVKELIVWAKDKPGGATVATFGRGSGPFISATAFQSAAGIRLRAVTYQGVAAGLQDLVAGHVDLGFADIAGAMPHIKSGAIKAYGLLSNARAAALPDLPTIEEAGGPPVQFITWRGMWAPKGTPADIIEQLNRSVVVALNDPGVQSRIAAAGQEIAPKAMQTRQALAAYHKASVETLAPLVKAAEAAEQ